MLCVNCGKELYDAARKCPYCGHEYLENKKEFVKIDEEHDAISYDEKVNYVRIAIATISNVLYIFASIVILLRAIQEDSTYGIVITAIFAVVGIGVITYLFYRPKSSKDKETEK